MSATLLLAALLVAQDPARPPAQPGAAPADRAAPAANVSLDGNWTVICLEKNGQPVPNAQNMTVTVRGNTATFNAAKATGDQPAGAGAAAGQNQMRALRLDFGRDGKVYVTEANAEGKFDTPATAPGAAPDRPGTPGAGADRPPGTAGVDRPSTAEERRNATGAGSSSGSETLRRGDNVPRPGEPAIPAGSKSGVYVLTQDYFAVCIHEENRPGTSPGLDRPGAGGADRPGAGGADRPGAGTGGTTGSDRPGAGTPGATDRPGAGGADRPAAGGAGQDRLGAGQDRPGAGAGAGLGSDRAGMSGGMMPQNRSYATVILKRSGGAGAPGGTGTTPK